jgi:hypothetical protein
MVEGRMEGMRRQLRIRENAEVEMKKNIMVMRHTCLPRGWVG